MSSYNQRQPGLRRFDRFEHREPSMWGIDIDIIVHPKLQLFGLTTANLAPA
jgi:hypothetical protein